LNSLRYKIAELASPYIYDQTPVRNTFLVQKYDSLVDDIVVVLDSLEDEFRKYLGVKITKE
jgi:hypothetical protein